MVRQRLATAFMIAACAAAPACSLLVNTSANQCNTTNDCTIRFPDAGKCRGLVCGDDHLCAELAIACCHTNAECIDAFKDQQYVCVRDRHVCQHLASVDCTRLLTDDGGLDLRNDDTVFLGASCDLTTSPSSGAAPCNGIELAAREIRAQGGLPPLAPGGPKRPLAMIVCDDTRTSDPTSARALLQHLADVGVPVILGTSSSDQDVTAITDFVVPTNTLLIGHSAQSSVLDSTPALSRAPPVGTRLYYRTSASDRQVVATMVRSITDYFEPTLKGPGGPVAAGEPLRVMILVRGDSASTAAGQLISDTITFNGKGAAANGSDYTSLPYPSLTAAEVAQSVVTTKPHVLVFLGLDEIYQDLIPRIDEGWTDPTHKPRLLIGGGRGRTPLLLTAVGHNDDLRRRTFGFSTGPVDRANTSYAQFVERYGLAFPDAAKDGAATDAAARGYDAAWLAFYAIALRDHAGGQPTAGSAIASFVPRLLPGPGRARVDVGAAGLGAGLASLDLGMDLVGASGPLDFDVGTGTPEQDVDMWYCTAGATGKATGFASSGYHYSALQKQIVGNPTVP